MPLPIHDCEEELMAKCRAGNRIILEAPTGSGKSTQTPQFLWSHGLLSDGDVVVLQPRRIAARMLAKRVAWEMGAKLGGLVGYQVRHDSVVSKETRIRFVTEGILLRRLIDDPQLVGTSVVIFDEFHERSLHADLTLARALQTQRESRPDLKIIVMSATLDGVSLESYLEPCQRVVSEGRTFPVEIRFARGKELAGRTPIWELAASKVVEAVGEQAEGHALVFMPGAMEIGRTMRILQQRLSGRDFEILPLYSDLSPDDQDRAMEERGRRKVIVATNVAETSLTIDNVRIVVDSGQARIARYDPSRGLNTLWIEKISDASARQRAGRAGRTAPGVCHRLWTEKEHESRPRFEAPEVKRLDLAETILALKASGVADLERFDWLERPSEERLRDSLELLRELRALDGQGGLTKVGRRLAGFPLHPRYGAMLLAAERFGCVREMALVAGMAQTRSMLLRPVDKATQRRRQDALGERRGSDALASLLLWNAARAAHFDRSACRELGVHGQAARQAGASAQQIVSQAERLGLDLDPAEIPLDEALGKCLLIGFPDRVCRRLDRGTLRCEMVGGRRGMLSRESMAQEEELFVACEINEIGGQGGSVTTVLNECSGIERSWLAEFFGDDFVEGEETVFDERLKRVITRRFVRYLDLVIESKESLESDEAAAAALLADLVKSGKAKLEKWDGEVEHLIRRANFLADVFPEYGIGKLEGETLDLLREACCVGARSLRDLKRQEVLPTVKEWMGRETLSFVESEAPLKIRLPNGRLARLRYEEGGRVVLSAKVQELYDLAEEIVICQGRVKPLVEILAPNSRPVQTTDNLAAFWRQSYPAIKKELKGRYPKHEWR